MAQSQEKRWQQAIDFERQKRAAVEENLETLAKQMNHLETRVRAQSKFPRSSSIRGHGIAIIVTVFILLPTLLKSRSINLFIFLNSIARKLSQDLTVNTSEDESDNEFYDATDITSDTSVNAPLIKPSVNVSTASLQSSNDNNTEVEDDNDGFEANAVLVPSCKCPEIRMLLEGPSKVNILTIHPVNTLNFYLSILEISYI